ncbi:hypothetical protein Tco_0500139 [Tanacetum coccineum]
MEIKIDEWEKSQNLSLEQTNWTDPPPPQSHTEQVNVVFTRSGKSDDSLKTQKDPPPPIIVDPMMKVIARPRWDIGQLHRKSEGHSRRIRDL